LCFVVLNGISILVHERRRLPLVERLSGLDIVVRIAKRSGLSGSMQPVGVNQRMATRGNDLDVLEADALEVICDDVGGLEDVGLVLLGGADTGDAEKRFEFVDETLLIFPGVRNGCG
jgi:hypothetical protein